MPLIDSRTTRTNPDMSTIVRGHDTRTDRTGDIYPVCLSGMSHGRGKRAVGSLLVTGNLPVNSRAREGNGPHAEHFIASHTVSVFSLTAKARAMVRICIENPNFIRKMIPISGLLATLSLYPHFHPQKGLFMPDFAMASRANLIDPAPDRPGHPILTLSGHEVGMVAVELTPQQCVDLASDLLEASRAGKSSNHNGQ